MGTRVRFHPLFMMVIVMSLLTGLFVELITLFGIIVIHETGHVIAARSLGWKVIEIRLLPFGGVAVLDDFGTASAWEEIGVAIAGPLQNALMILFGAMMLHWKVWDPLWGLYFMKANVMIGLFNLIPVLPLDGGKMMKALFSLYLSYHRTMVYTTFISIMISLLFIGVSLYPVYTQGIQLNILVIGIFLLYTNWLDYRNIPYHFLRFLIKRNANVSMLMSKGILARPIVVGKQMKLTQLFRLFMRGQYHLICILNDHGRICAVVPEQQLTKQYFIENKSDHEVSDLLS